MTPVNGKSQASHLGHSPQSSLFNTWVLTLPSNTMPINSMECHQSGMVIHYCRYGGPPTHPNAGRFASPFGYRFLFGSTSLLEQSTILDGLTLLWDGPSCLHNCTGVMSEGQLHRLFHSLTLPTLPELNVGLLLHCELTALMGSGTSLPRNCCTRSRTGILQGPSTSIQWFFVNSMDTSPSTPQSDPPSQSS
jgi:hypothetical protein